MKVHKRTLKESEEVIKSLQKRLWASDELIREMRMSLYYVKEHLKVVSAELDGMWHHHLDGSDLIVSKSELFDVIHNKILINRIKRGMDCIDKPLAKLKDHVGW